jgi:uncharacterized protein YbjT (DUF2867 family)
MIYVTAGGGYVGREIVERLEKAGQRVRALVTSPEEARSIQGPNVEMVVGDRAHVETFAHTLAGADVAMLLTRNALDLVAKDASFCKAARAAGVRRVVKLSAFGADVNAEPGAKRVHGASEQAVQQSGLHWTFLRPQFFMQNMLWFINEIRASGSFSLPMGSGRVGMIDHRDIADVAVRCLTESGHEGRIYKLSGPELLSCADIAAKLTRATGIPIRFNDMPPDDFRKLLMSMGRPAWHAEEMTVSYVGMSNGASAVLTEDVQHVLGRPATSFDRVAADYAHLFRGNSPQP